MGKKRQPGRPPGFRPVSHTADVGFKLWGPTPADIFIQGAQALYSLMTDRRRLRASLVMEVKVQAPDQEALLVEWLNYLLYLFDTREFLGRKIDILELAQTYLRARLYGEKLAPERHELKTGVKAATYHQLTLHPTPAGWEATIILDL